MATRNFAVAAANESDRFDVSDTFAIRGIYRKTWFDYDQASSAIDPDTFQISLGWKF